MMLTPNETGKFWNLLCFVHKNVKSEYKLKLSEEKYLSVLISHLVKVIMDLN